MTRDEISALLPFLANDTLTGDERAEVAAAVAADAELQAELAALRAIRATMQAEDSFSPAEIGLARLMRAVKAEAPARRTGARPRLWQAVAAALLVVVVAQAAFQMRGTEPGGFQLAGEAAFTLAVRPDTTEQALRDLLLQAGVRIVDGPSALGLYDLAPLEGVTIDQTRAILEASDIVESLGVPEE